MGKFDGILLCADIDGTLTYPYKGVDADPNDNGPTAETCEKIRWFQKNGGWFTVSTGRRPSHLQNFTDKFVVNAPVVGLGGGLVYDTEKEKVLRLRTMQFDLPALMKEIEDLFPYVVTAHLHSMEEMLLTGLSELCDPEKTVWKPDTFLKIVLSMDNASHAIEVRNRLGASSIGQHCCVCRSWPEGLEVMENAACKGEAVLFLKKYLGARQLICVGDYENDLTMLRVADRSVAVENALPEVKAAAKETTVSVFDGAVGHVIDTI